MIELILKYEEKTPYLRGMVGYFGLKQARILRSRKKGTMALKIQKGKFYLK